MMNRNFVRLLQLCIPFAVVSCQNLDTGASNGETLSVDAGTPGDHGGMLSPQARGLIQCDAGSPECFALCGSPSCALLDAAIPPELASPVFYLPDGAAVKDPCLAVAADSIEVRQKSCVPCHEGSQRLGGFDYVLDDTKLSGSASNVATDDAGMHLKMLVPGDPEQSFVYQRVMLGQMPPPMSAASSIIGPTAAKKLVYPSAADETVLYAWIMCLGGADGGPYAGNYAGPIYGPTVDGGGAYWNGSTIPSGSGGTGSSSGSSGSGSGVTGSSGGSSGSGSGVTGSSSGSSGSGSGVTGSSGVASVDAAQYNFERGMRGWMSSAPPITGVMTSSTEVFAGNRSLAVNFNGPAGTAQVLVNNPPTPAGALVTFHVWIPAGSPITVVQPFVQQGPAGGFTFTGPSTSIGNLTAGAWNTMTVMVPRNAMTPLNALGVQFITNATWTGTVYIDSIGW
ncbi:MAG: hypothetical protein M3O46_04825 [Myxococcota bacterium]|nr:hypothetical protein [Myxococcota bacterium]